MWGKPNVEIHCNDCKENTKFDMPEYIQCQHCDEKIKLKGSFIKGFGKKTLLVAAVASSIAFSQVDDVLYPDFYPSSIQYAIIETCIAGDDISYLSSDEVKKKRSICLCAFESTKEKIGYTSFQSDQGGFIYQFRRQIEACG